MPMWMVPVILGPYLVGMLTLLTWIHTLIRRQVDACGDPGHCLACDACKMPRCELHLFADEATGRRLCSSCARKAAAGEPAAGAP